MNRIRAIAQEYGLVIEYADLGDWGLAELRSEYDPCNSTIRINTRAVENLAPEDVSDFVAFAIAHEIYHYLEHRQRIPKLSTRAARESAASDFARTLLRSTP